MKPLLEKLDGIMMLYLDTPVDTRNLSPAATR
jgi:hypothetical protein